MVIRSDPKFQSEYDYNKDQHVTLPKEGFRNDSEIITPDEEFKRLLNSSNYSVGSESLHSIERKFPSEKSSLNHLRKSKYTALTKSDEKGSTRNQNSRELLFRIGGSIVSSDLNLSKNTLSQPQNPSSYLPRYSDIYPSTSTGLDTNSTMVRIRGKQDYYNLKQKESFEYSPKQEQSISDKMKDVEMASRRLKKLEILEKKRVDNVKNEIGRLEEERLKDQEERKKKRKELIERKKKLVDDRRKLEMKKKMRIEKQNEQEKKDTLSIFEGF
jgi:hypothetical protein